MTRSSIFEVSILALVWIFVFCVAVQFLSGCALPVKRPDTNVYGVNAPAGKMEGYNVLHDYDSSGNLIVTTGFTQIKPVNSLFDINGWKCTDPLGATNGEIAISDTRNYISKHCTCK